MLVLLHIIIACLSLIVTGYSCLFPSRAKIVLSGALVVLTLGSGTVLTITTPAHLVSACVSGLIFLAISSVGIAISHRRLCRSEA